MTSQDSPGTARVTVTSQDSPRTARVSVTSQDSPGTAIVTMTPQVVDKTRLRCYWNRLFMCGDSLSINFGPPCY